MRLTATLILALAPFGALAEGPTGADLLDGIRLTRADAGAETFIRRDVGAVEFSSELGSHGLDMTVFEGLRDGRPVPDTRSFYVYPLLPDAAPELTPAHIRAGALR